MWRNRDSVENEKSKSYLFTVAYNQMIDHIRKVKKISLTDEFTETSRGVNFQPTSNVQKTLREALNRLNETQRSLVMLKDYEGYNYEEIGQITGLNESQVKVYLHRARITLRNYLGSRENVM
jgi:RNA polymerase sigma-70 factor (ECF subfamily)